MHAKPKNVEIISPKAIFVGDAQAAVTLTMFGEYESETCAKANIVVNKLLDEFKGKLRFNFRHFPLTQIHQRSHKAAEAAVAAAQEGKFWDMHNALFVNRKQLGTISLKGYAREVGVTNKKFLDELMNSTYSWEVRSDLLDGLERGVRDVPAFFINGEIFEGTPNHANLSKAVDLAIKKNKRKNTAKQRE
jgi:protein-disulfide isomerase